MLYDEKTATLSLDTAEAVALSLFSLKSQAAGSRADIPLENGTRPPASHKEATPYTLSHTFLRDGLSFSLAGKAYESEGGVFLCRCVTCSPLSPDRTVKKRVRGEGFLLAYLAMLANGNSSLSVTYCLENPQTGESGEWQETVTKKDGEKFFEKIAAALPVAGKEEIERVSRRLPTLARLPFPYKERRLGQNEMMEAVYASLCRGERLYLTAPTGTGKTLAALYPALRALGARKAEKVFYFTPKTTTAREAAKALMQFAAVGGEFRAVCLRAKERLCPRKMLCRGDEGFCPASSASGKKEEEAALSLLHRALPVVGEEEIAETANEYGLCPYELSLRYSMFCDVIVCDYNYLFDPHVRLHRYFEKEGKYAFLIDEAHDLFDRVRETASATLTAAEIGEFCAAAEDGGELKGTADALSSLFSSTLQDALEGEKETQDEHGVPHAVSQSGLLPETLAAAVGKAAQDALFFASNPKNGSRLSLRRLRLASYPLRDFALRAAAYTSAYRTFYKKDGASLSLSLVCLDPADWIDGSLSRGHGAVLFSATLTPLSYYRTVLGGKNGGMELDLPSPFDEGHLAVAVMDKISTRYTQREESAPQIANAILAMLKEKAGHYLVFAPSFAYMETLASAFSSLSPATPVAVQPRYTDSRTQRAFLARFDETPNEPLVGFAVMGSVFSEGVDLLGTRLIGAVIVGVSLPHPSPEREAMAAYYTDLYETGKEYAYMYPGMNRVLQAAGRVIRSEDDRGVLLLVDDRFGDPFYRRMIPPHWRHLKYVGETKGLSLLLSRFWQKNEN